MSAMPFLARQGRSKSVANPSSPIAAKSISLTSIEPINASKLSRASRIAALTREQFRERELSTKAVRDFCVIYRPGPGIGGKIRDEAGRIVVLLDLMNVLVSIG
jgi:hypothetical protein